jgi:hypothetical protein
MITKLIILHNNHYNKEEIYNKIIKMKFNISKRVNNLIIK